MNGTKPAGGWSLVQDNVTDVSVISVALSVIVGSEGALTFCGKATNEAMKNRRSTKAILLFLLIILVGLTERR